LCLVHPLIQGLDNFGFALSAATNAVAVVVVVVAAAAAVAAARKLMSLKSVAPS